MNQIELEVLLSFFWQMAPLLVPLLVIGTFIVGSLLHFLSTEVKLWRVRKSLR